MTKKDAIVGTGFFDHDENYVVNPGADDLYLIGTSEVPLTSFHAGEALPESALPRQMAGYSPCFRREAGSYGKDTSGMLRVHQFEKIEMVGRVPPRRFGTRCTRKCWPPKKTCCSSWACPIAWC